MGCATATAHIPATPPIKNSLVAGYRKRAYVMERKSNNRDTQKNANEKESFFCGCISEEDGLITAHMCMHTQKGERLFKREGLMCLGTLAE